MDNSPNAHLPILIQLALGVLLPVAILVASHLFGQRVRREHRYPSRDEPYECGITPEPAASNPHPRNAVKYTTTAMLFLLFDIEAVFLVPWALGYRELLTAEGRAATVTTIIFTGLLAFGLFYELRRGALTWDKPAPAALRRPAPIAANTAAIPAPRERRPE